VPSRNGLLVFLWWRDVGQGGTWACCTTTEVMVFYVHEEPALQADPLPSVPTLIDPGRNSTPENAKTFNRPTKFRDR